MCVCVRVWVWKRETMEIIQSVSVTRKSSREECVVRGGRARQEWINAMTCFRATWRINGEEISFGVVQCTREGREQHGSRLEAVVHDGQANQTQTHNTPFSSFVIWSTKQPEALHFSEVKWKIKTKRKTWNSYCAQQVKDMALSLWGCRLDPWPCSGR